MTRSVAALITLAVVGLTMYAAIRAHRDLTDFEVYRTAAVRAADGQALYRPDDGHYQFKYLPAFAVLARPLTWMRAETAKLLWFGLSFAMLSWVLKTLVLDLPNRQRTALTLGGWTVLVMGKFWVRELALGQTNVLLSLLLLPAVVGLARRPRLAAAGVGAAVFVKPYAALLLPWLALRAPRRTLGVATAVVVIGLLLPMAIYGWTGNLELLAEWLRTVRDTTSPNLLHPDNVSLWSMWAKWLGPGQVASGLALLTSALASGAVLWACLAGRHRPEAAYLEGGLLMLLMPLLSPQGWDYVLLLGTPVVVAVVDRWGALPRTAQVVAVAVGIVLATPVRLVVSPDTYNALMASAGVSVAAIGLLGLGLVLRARSLA